MRKTLGAIFIAGAATVVTHAEPVEKHVDEILADAEAYITEATGLDDNELGILGLAGAGLLTLMGVGAIARSTRRKLEKEQYIAPAVLAQMESANADLVAQIKGNNNDVVSALRQVSRSLDTVDSRLAGELNVDISSLEQAGTEMQSVEAASARVLQTLQKIENTADAFLQVKSPEGVYERYAQAQKAYDRNQGRLLQAAQNAVTDSRARTSWYPEFFNNILGKAGQLDLAVASFDGDTQAVATAAQNLSSTVSKHSDTIITKIVNGGSKPGYSSPHLSAVSTVASQLILSANEVVAAKIAIAKLDKSQKATNDNLASAPEQSTDLGENHEQDSTAETLEQNEDGMIEVPGYGAFPANPVPAPQFD